MRAQQSVSVVPVQLLQRTHLNGKGFAEESVNNTSDAVRDGSARRGSMTMERHYAWQDGSSDDLSRRVSVSSGPPGAQGGPAFCRRWWPARTRTLLLLALAALAGRVARIALGLRFGLERRLPGGLFFLFAGKLSGSGSCRLGFARLLFGLGGLAGLAGFGAGRSLRLALGLALLDLGIVRPGLGLELVQDVLPRLLRGLLAVCEAWFLESLIKGALSFSFLVVRRGDRRFALLLSEPATEYQRRRGANREISVNGKCPK